MPKMTDFVNSLKGYESNDAVGEPEPAVLTEDNIMMGKIALGNLFEKKLNEDQAKENQKERSQKINNQTEEQDIKAPVRNEPFPIKEDGEKNGTALGDSQSRTQEAAQTAAQTENQGQEEDDDSETVAAFHALGNNNGMTVPPPLETDDDPVINPEPKSPNIVYDDEDNEEVTQVSHPVQPELRVGRGHEENKENKHAYDLWKKVAVGLACVILVCVIPVMFALVQDGVQEQDSAKKQNKKSSYETLLGLDSTEEEYTSTIENSESETTQETNNVTDSKSSRFKTIDDLTLYIQSSTSYNYSEIKQCVTKYENGTINLDEMRQEMGTYEDELNTTYRLLTINEAVYEDENQMDKYNELLTDMNDVFSYVSTYRN